MILIISQDSFESTSNLVIDWIEFNSSPWERVNAIDLVTQAKIDFQNQKPSSKYNVMWCRRLLSYNNHQSLLTNSNDTIDIDKYYRKEIKTLLNYRLESFDSKFRLNKNFLLYSENKLEVLKVAHELGVDIPNSAIVSSKKGVLDFAAANKNFITKGISGSGSVNLGKNLYSSYTAEVDINDLSELSETFIPCFLQEKLDKVYEIRAFYLNRKFYSMVIFSQSDEQTSMDFRRYNLKKMNRLVPYSLPSRIEDKLTLLMDALNLNTGSIDIVKTVKGDYVFLEVNPEGQFGMVSNPCNYNLEEKMADYLIEKNNEYEKIS